MTQTTTNNATINNANVAKEEIAMTKEMRIKDTWRRVQEATKITDAEYVKRDELVELFDDCMGNRPGNKVTRAQLVESLETMVKSFDKPVESDAEIKTKMMLSYIKEVAESNKKNGYGYTISDFMLRASILKADNGLERLKGHDVTPEEQDTINRCYVWLKKAGIVKPVVYTVAEDKNVRVYMPEYDGKTDSKKTKMVPYNKSAGYNAIGVTSFKVTLN